MLAGQTAQAQSNERVGIDHLILRASSLRSGMEIFTRQTGITPKVGGQHPGRGTENALVSLGRDLYIEILAPITPAPPSETLQAIGWALHSNALEELIARVRTAGFDPVGPTPGSRRTPDGQLLEWRTAGVEGKGLELAPFVIEWGKATPHPAGTSPGGCTLAGVTLILPDTTRLGGFLTAAGVSIPLTVGPAPELRVSLDCPRGRVSYTSARAP
jgi:hypothetical protein